MKMNNGLACFKKKGAAKLRIEGKRDAFISKSDELSLPTEISAPQDSKS